MSSSEPEAKVETDDDADTIPSLTEDFNGSLMIKPETIPEDASVEPPPPPAFTTPTASNTKSKSSRSKSPKTPKTPKTPKKSKDPKTPKAPKTPKTPKSSKVPKTPKTGKTPKGSKTPKSARGKSKKSSRKKGDKKKGITFRKTVGVHTIPNLSTYTVEEKELSWFTPDEYGEMEDECDLTAEILDRNKPLWPGHCSRGLESWTLEGEQRKEGHVQLAIDLVWQAQLDQWKASVDYKECWEYIREKYTQVSKPCHKLASDRGLADEKEVYSYLAGVPSVEKNRLRLLGISYRDRGIRRSGSDRSLDAGKGVLKTTGEDEIEKAGRESVRRRREETGAGDDDVSTASSKYTTASGKKISYKPKSRSKVPVSPVGSMATDVSDEDSVSRRMRSHMSVASEDSTRRRMLRTASIKPL